MIAKMGTYTRAFRMFAVMVMMFMAFAADVNAQTGTPPSLGGIKGKLQEQTATAKSIIGIIIGIALLIGLITVVWKLVSGAQDAKTYLIGLIVGIIVYAIFWAIL